LTLLISIFYCDVGFINAINLVIISTGFINILLLIWRPESPQRGYANRKPYTSQATNLITTHTHTHTHTQIYICQLNYDVLLVNY